MPDQIESTVEPTTEPVVETPAEPVVETPDHTTEVEKWKALSRKNEQRAKENEAKAKRLDEIEEANKTEAEKLQARVDAAEKIAAEATLRALRADVSLAKGVPADLLSGSTQDELEASADALLTFRGETPKAPPATPQGAVGSPVNTGAQGQLTKSDIAGMTPQEINQARAEGRLDLLLGITT